MATATVTTTAGLWGCTEGRTFTGGSTGDRLTIEDIVAAEPTLQLDQDTRFLTQTDTVSRSYLIGGDVNDSVLAKDAFAHFFRFTVQLKDTPGSDNSSLDLGNQSSKFLIGNQADVIVGQYDWDTPADDGVMIRAANYTFNFFGYIPIGGQHSKIVCYGGARLGFSGRDNARVMFINQNPQSDAKFLLARASLVADEYATSGGSVANTTGNILSYGSVPAYRPNLTTGVPQTNVVAATLISESAFGFFSQSSNTLLYYDDIKFTNPSGVTGAFSSTVVSTGGQETDLVYRRFNSRILNRTRRYGGDTGDNNFHFERELNFKGLNPLGESIAGNFVLEHSDYSVSYGAINTAPIVTLTPYGDVTRVNDVTEVVRDFRYLSVAKTNTGNQSNRDASHVSVEETLRQDARYSFYSWGFVFSRLNDFVIDDLDDKGRDEVQIVVVPDETLSANAIGDVVTTITDPQSLYDNIYKYCFENELENPATKIGETVDLSSFNLVIDDSALNLVDISGNTITVDSTEFTGNISTTGLVTGKEFVTGTVFDSTQDSSLSDVGDAEISVYYLEADRDSRTNAIVVNTTRWSFIHANLTSTTVYLWVKSGTTELPVTMTLVQGRNEVDLGTGALIRSLPVTIDDVLADRLDSTDLPGTVAAATYATFTEANNADAFKSDSNYHGFL